MKKRLLGIAGALVVLALMVLAGCASMVDAVSGETEVETETSLVIKNAATGFVLAKEDGVLRLEMCPFIPFQP